MADFGVYFEITNKLPGPLYFTNFKPLDGGCGWDPNNPTVIPNDGNPHQVHFTDPNTGEGAEGWMTYVAEVEGVTRQYVWHGDCPVWSPTNKADGPGVSAFNSSGHPLTVTIAVNEATTGWTEAAQPVQNVFVLMLENRAFDHMLGFAGITGTDAVTGQSTAVDGLTGNESNSYNNTSYPVTQGADVSMPLDPGHDFPDVVVQLCGPNATYPPGGPYPSPIDMSGFVDNYVTMGGQANPAEIMKCYTAQELPVLNALINAFAVCDAWHSSMPGPTWPNRFFAMAASAGGLDRSPSIPQMIWWESAASSGFTFEHGSLFQALTTANIPWRVYRGDVGPTPGAIPIAGAVAGVSTNPVTGDVYNYSNFASDIKGARGPYTAKFTWIEPNYGSASDGTYKGGTSQHPMDDITAGERLIKDTYEAIRNSPLWQSSLLIVTWDEHGGFYDHVAPGAATPPGDKITATDPPGDNDPINQFGFTFDLYGVRIPAVVVSPYVGTQNNLPLPVIDHRLYDHASIPATVERLFGLPPLTNRDKGANDVTALLTLTTPRADAPTTLPNPANLGPVPAAEPPSAAALAEPIGHSNLAGFLHVALRIQLEMTPPEEHDAIVAHVASLETRGQALAYIDDIVTKLNLATGSPAASAH